MTIFFMWTPSVSGLLSVTCPALLLPRHSIPRTLASDSHKDVLEVSTYRQVLQHGLIRLGQQLGCGHIDIIHLRQTGNTEAGIEYTALFTLGDQLLLIEQARPRSDQAHLTLEHIPQLRQ